MTPLHDSEYEKLARLAEKARRGPWSVSLDWVVSQHGIAVAQAYLGFGGPEDGVAEVFTGPNDAAYIAALSPNVVLAMVAERRALREALAELVACKDLLDAADADDQRVLRVGPQAIGSPEADARIALALSVSVRVQDYKRRMPLAWATARAALNGAAHD